MAFWIFKCSPDKYQRSEQLADPNPAISWKATQCPDEIWPGATAFIWETAQHRGIRADMRIDEAPRESTDLPSEQPYSYPPVLGIVCRVRETLTHRDASLPHTALRLVRGLENLAVAHGDVFQQTTNFAVTEKEREILLQLLASQPP